MLFDNETIKSDRVQFSDNYLENYNMFYDKIKGSLNDLNESFYNLSKEITLVEGYDKLQEDNNHILMNESVKDFIEKFTNMIKNTTDILDKSFAQYKKFILTRYGKMDKIINTYRKEFIDRPNVQASITPYSFSDNIPDFNVMNDIATGSIITDIKKININKIQKMNQKDEKYYAELRGNILGLKNKLIKENDFRTVTYKTYRSNSDNKILVNLDSKFKLKLLQNISSCEFELKNLEQDLKQIKDFAKLNGQILLKEFEYISKISYQVSKTDYDILTEYIYNKLNEYRLVINYYEYALGAKMDALKDRRNEYFEIFVKVINGEKLVESNMNLTEREDFYLDYNAINEDFNKLDLDKNTYLVCNKIYNEDMILFSEAPDFILRFKEIMNKIWEAISKIFDKFKNGTQDKINKIKEKNRDYKKYQKMNLDFELEGLYASEIKVFINSARELGKNASININEEDFKSDLTLIRKLFPTLSNGFNPKSESGSEFNDEWKEHIKNKLRGKKLKTAKEALPYAINFLDPNELGQALSQISKNKSTFDSLKSKIDSEINKAKSGTNTTSDNNKTESENLLKESEEESGNKVEFKNEIIKQNAYEKNKDTNTGDFNDKSQSANGNSKILNNFKKLITECSKVNGWIMSEFNLRINSFNTYFIRLDEVLNNANKEQNKEKSEEENKE